MSRWSARRAQVEPVAAVVAVLALCLALVAYGSVSAGVLPGPGASAPAGQVLDDAVDAATTEGSVVVSPSALSGTVAPAGYQASVRLTADNRSWNTGADAPPPEAASASRRVPVRVAPGEVAPGRLTVAVWQ
ncbi:DUF7285 family protein [Halobacterium jilantaiense]|uniref:Uncharacterized protein n=1 Tax=Halobacterium jilantaiense TaxID=355548 RepID=A0A1I0NZF1_9EURY|nr:hypothetical protein [Halobacterium jilantaiense]SEW07235.1 hypothetical protein SAMN04487945_1271 [Halobacterium jilantaiense]